MKKENMFNRNLDNSIIDELQKSDLWNNHLKADCENQKVFFAIRNNEIGFYHEGGRLFGYDKTNAFKTHFKYASVMEKMVKGDYLTETELSKTKLISKFSDNYEQIKKNCALYSGDEAKGVSEIYSKNSYLSGKKIVVLDIEVSFESLEEEKKQDRIDILLFDTETRVLKFVEAKHYSNKDIKAEIPNPPKVIGQIKRYENQIAEKKTEIIKEYTKYVKIINDIFGTSLHSPIDVEPKVTLLIFGYDDNQKKGDLSKYVLKNDVYRDCIVYSNKGAINLETLWTTNHINLCK